MLKPIFTRKSAIPYTLSPLTPLETGLPDNLTMVVIQHPKAFGKIFYRFDSMIFFTRSQTLDVMKERDGTEKSKTAHSC